MLDNYSMEYGKNSMYPARRYSYNLRLSMLKKIINGSTRILDIGSATGDYVIDLKNEGYRVVSLDINLKSLKTASKKDSDINYLNGEAANLPIKNESFDTIIIQNAFRYFNNPAQALKECHRILKPGGKLVIIDHNKYCPDSFFVKHDVVRYYTMANISRMMLEVGFKRTDGVHFFVPPPFVEKDIVIKGLALIFKNNLPAVCLIYPEITVNAIK